MGDGYFDGWMDGWDGWDGDEMAVLYVRFKNTLRENGRCCFLTATVSRYSVTGKWRTRNNNAVMSMLIG